MKFRFFPAANQRLDEIWHYSVEQWGEEQAERYIRGLFEGIARQADHRILWRPVKESGFPGVYTFRHEHHFVFFRELPGGDLGVLSILHESMDLPRRLREAVKDTQIP